MNETKVDYIVFESTIARMERVNKRLCALIIMIFLAFVATNIGWIVYENGFEEVTITQDAPDGNNNYVGGNGSITNGETGN